jgi:hypothetical protein
MVRVRLELGVVGRINLFSKLHFQGRLHEERIINNC